MKGELNSERNEMLDDENFYFSDFSDTESPSISHTHFYLKEGKEVCRNKGKGLREVYGSQVF